MKLAVKKLVTNRVFLEIFSFVSLLGGWWFLSLNYPPRIIPGPVLVFNLVINNFVSGDAFFQLYKTLTRVVVGFLLSLAIGISLGILMGTRRLWESYFGILLTIGLAVPSLCWALISVMWFGVSDAVAYIPIVMIVFPIVTVHIWEGVKAVDKSLVDMSKAFRVSKLRTIRNVYIPMLMPHILSTMRFAFATSWKIVTIAEVFGLSNGVGYMLAYWYHEFYTAQVFAWALIFVVIMIFIERFIFDRISKRAFKWRPETKL